MVIGSPKNGISHLLLKHFFISLSQKGYQIKVDIVLYLTVYTLYMRKFLFLSYSFSNALNHSDLQNSLISNISWLNRCISDLLHCSKLSEEENI